ncbi:hypothetical protein A2U01_0103154, partial [Trifolium medium]|nr:hypothetical protein [Trifolium medium]
AQPSTKWSVAPVTHTHAARHTTQQACGAHHKPSSPRKDPLRPSNPMARATLVTSPTSGKSTFAASVK